MIICKAVKVIFTFGTSVKIFLSILHSWFPIWIQLVCLPNLPSLVTIYSDKKTIRVNTSYFSFFFPNKLMTTEIVLKGKILCWLTKLNSICSSLHPAFITFRECYNGFMAILYLALPRLCIDCKKATSRCTTNLYLHHESLANMKQPKSNLKYTLWPMPSYCNGICQECLLRQILILEGV